MTSPSTPGATALAILAFVAGSQLASALTTTNDSPG